MSDSLSESRLVITRRLAAAAIVAACLSPIACGDATAPSLQLLANVVDPQDVNAVSAFHSCQGHAYPQPNSPNSAKNYFWPNSTNFSTTTVLKIFAACTGTVKQVSQDNSADQQDRGRTLHLYCDGSSTRLRYFHLNFNASVLGQHVTAGQQLGTASMLGTGQTASTAWQYSSNFDIAVSESNDNNTVDYFSKLDATALAAWGARGITSGTQTNIASNPTCTAWNASFAAPEVVLLTPAR